MPCRSDDRDYDTVQPVYVESIKADMHQDTDLTALLCEAMQVLERHQLTSYTSKELQKWWDGHKQLDRSRVQREWKNTEGNQKRRSQLLSMLTEHEKQYISDANET